ncbi:hypothetical protein [Streptomyces viridosporus]|uniref:Uncharacterized protein n=1 Tax=Streptomyces viridosporus T7A TaxID=665577 RepID=A0ABX6A8C7_STRVD|nr:hypothetical protein CP969_02575 [Streptomyces viridosporus T7A]
MPRRRGPLEPGGDDDPADHHAQNAGQEPAAEAKKAQGTAVVDHRRREGARRGMYKLPSLLLGGTCFLPLLPGVRSVVAVLRLLELVRGAEGGTTLLPE